MMVGVASKDVRNTRYGIVDPSESVFSLTESFSQNNPILKLLQV